MNGPMDDDADQERQHGEDRDDDDQRPARVRHDEDDGARRRDECREQAGPGDRAAA